MRNKYQGICYVCGNHVAAGAGHFERINGKKKWRVQCAIHPIEKYESPQGIEEWKQRESRKVVRE